MAYTRRRRRSRTRRRSTSYGGRSSYRSRARVSRPRSRFTRRRSGGARTVRIVVQTVPAIGATGETAVKPRVAMF